MIIYVLHAISLVLHVHLQVQILAKHVLLDFILKMMHAIPLNFLVILILQMALLLVMVVLQVTILTTLTHVNLVMLIAKHVQTTQHQIVKVVKMVIL